MATYTQVPRSKFLAAIELVNSKLPADAQIKVEVQSRWMKVQGKDGSRRVYVLNKDKVTAVDVSGFTSAHAVKHPKPPTSKVEQRLDFSLPEQAIVRCFLNLLVDMVGGIKKQEAPAPSTTPGLDEAAGEALKNAEAPAPAEQPVAAAAAS